MSKDPIAVEFGQFLSAIMKYRLFKDSTGKLRPLTMQDIQELTGISEASLKNIKSGRTFPDRENVLKLLAEKAFQLSEMEKVEFYAKAHQIYRPRAINISDDLLVDLLTSHRQPAAALTRLGDVLAINEYGYRLYKFTEAIEDAFGKSKLGPNILRLLLDPKFNMRSNFTSDNAWKQEVVRNLRAFKVESLRFVATDRYKSILKGLEKYAQFGELWFRANEDPEEKAHINPELTFRTSFGDLRFLITRIPHGYIASDVILTVLVPFDVLDRNYQDFTESVGENGLHRFDEQPLMKMPT